jgi:hypothetical protein
MYHITSNNPPVGSVNAIPESGKITTSLSAALVTDGSVLPVDPRRHKLGTRSITIGSSTIIRQPASPSPGTDALHDSSLCNTLVACWGPFQTLDQMRASPYYMRIDLPSVSENMIEREKSPASQNEGHSATILPENTPARYPSGKNKRRQGLEMHTVLPIPECHLKDLTQSHRDFLYGYLLGWRCRPGSKLSRRVEETLEVIGEVTDKHDTHV